MDAAIKPTTASEISASDWDPNAYLPLEVPGVMPISSLSDFEKLKNQKVPTSFWARVDKAFRQTMVLGGTAVLAGLIINEMRLVLNVDGLTILEMVVLVLFAINTLWIAMPAVASLVGFIRLLIFRPCVTQKQDPLRSRTAILMPLHNEDPVRVTAALDAMAFELVRLGEGHSFDIFILSDTTDGNIALAEEESFIKLRRRLHNQLAVYYRRRSYNTGHKSGNIREFCERWGLAYDHLLILDADSLMDGKTIIELSRRLENDPESGLIQTVPHLHDGTTMVARLQQFAGSVYGPVLTAGLAWWTGKEGNFWGHNAILRTRAFMTSAGLPELPGKPPMGGPILSHDFVEAALIRRAGWSVIIADDLDGSYEACPPTVYDLAVRDRRWCQGNLQHLRILGAKGLKWTSRLHLLTGIYSFLSSAIWLLFLIATLTLGVQNEFSKPEYFGKNYTLFPLWPHLDPIRALQLFVLTLIILLTPKVLGMFWVLLRPKRLLARGGLLFPLSIVLEVFLSALLAPIMMLVHCGFVMKILTGQDGGWKPQRRGNDGLPILQVIYFHRWHIFIGINLSMVGYLISWDMFAWLLPATLCMVLAVPISVITGSAWLGHWLKRMRFLETPVEASVPVIERSAKEVFAIYQTAVKNAPDLITLISNEEKLERHFAILGEPLNRVQNPIRVVEAIANYKVWQAESLNEVVKELSPEECAFILSSKKLLRRLAFLQSKHGYDSRTEGSLNRFKLSDDVPRSPGREQEG